MKNFQHLLFVLLGLLFAACSNSLFAQAPADDPFGGAALQESPAVRAALEWPRDNPQHALQAVLALVDLGRPELAMPILEELQGRGLDESQRAALVDRFGSHRMMQLARVEALLPVGAEFAQANMAAASAIATNPQRLAQLLAELSDPAPDVRRAARSDLNATGWPGVTAVLEALARENDPQRRSDLIAAAAFLRPLVDGPLLAMLTTDDLQLHADVANLLGQMQIPQAVPLIADAQSPTAELALRSALNELEQGVPPFAADAENHVELWFWNDATKTLVSASYPADEARTIWMARLALRLAQVRPDVDRYRVQAVTLGAEAGGLALLGAPSDPAAQLPQLPVAVRWPAADTRLVLDVLAEALQSNYAHAAVAACDELARRGDPAVLLTADAKPSPLANALLHGDRRVRFAALRAIMTLDPQSPYPGSSRVPDALAYFARGAGQRDAIVAMPNLSAATDLAGKLATAGLHGEATFFGRDVARMGAQMPDLELVLVDMNILLPGVRQVLYELRITPATAQTPVALLAADGRLEAAHRLASEHERVIAVPRPHSAEATAQIATRLLELAERDATAADERAQQAVIAIAWTANLLEHGRNYYALRREAPAIESALYQRATTASAIDALAHFRTADSQRALLKFASQRTLPIDTRKQAASAFETSVRAGGLLLTSEELLAQYAVYNASAAADSDTQQVLGALLDVIESRRAEANEAALNP